MFSARIIQFLKKNADALRVCEKLSPVSAGNGDETCCAEVVVVSEFGHVSRIVVSGV